MSFPVGAVANEFLDLARGASEKLDPMRIQKLVYYAHGWHLAVFDEPLIDETIEAWQFGPVIPSLYHQFKDLGADAIERPFLKGVLRPSRSKRLHFETLEPRLPKDDSAATARAVIARVWEAYRPFTAVQLSNMTHAVGTPWDAIRGRFPRGIPRGQDIPDAEIGQYFKVLLAS